MNQKATKRDVLITVAAAAVCLLLYLVLGRFIKNLFQNDFAGYFAGQLFLAVLAMAAVIFLKKTALFKSEGRYLGKGWLSAGLLFVMFLLWFFLGLSEIVQATITKTELILFLGQMFLVGFGEEVLFRGLIQRTLHQYFVETNLKQVLTAIFISGVIFGGVHLFNGIGAKIPMTAAVIQSAVNIFSGMYFGAIYYRTGKNIWYLIFLHAIYDMLGFIAGGRLSGNAPTNIMSAPSTAGWIGYLIWMAVYALATLFVLRPKKTAPLLKKEEDQTA
ncbi:MAG: CPBP family intramembrane metalloprotease [Erysipelotrichaceae bacterium]|nr:CPBP family intramembrane metalloprotease [Erysipelotrichaceae bacterium]